MKTVILGRTVTIERVRVSEGSRLIAAIVGAMLAGAAVALPLFALPPFDPFYTLLYVLVLIGIAACAGSCFMVAINGTDLRFTIEKKEVA